MASSSFKAKAQAPITCFMCEETTKIQSKCLDCDNFLCERCTKLHEKVKTEQAHRIVELKEPEERFTPEKCLAHPDKLCIMYCQECEELVCTACIMTNHRKHPIADMKIVYEDNIEFLKQFREEIDKSILPDISRTHSRLDNIMQSHYRRNERVGANIEEYKTYLITQTKNILQDEAKRFYKELDVHVEKIKDKVSPQMLDLDKSEKYYTDLRAKIDEIMLSRNVSSVFSLKKKIDSNPESSMNVQLDVSGLTSFLKLKQSNVRFPLLGNLELTASVTIQYLESITTNLSCVDKILSSKGGEIFLRNWETRSINKCKIQNEKTIELKTWKSEVKDMAVLKSGNILIILADKTEVRCLTSKGSTEKSQAQNTALYYDATPQIPTGIHVSTDNKVIISTVEPGRDWLPMDDPCKVEVIVLTEDGKVISIFEYKDLFCFPNKIATVHDGICIADSISDYSGRIVKLDYDGKVKWIYGDESSSLIVGDMISTPLSNIVFFDACQTVLRIIDSDSKPLGAFGLDSLQISYPYSMAISYDDKLLIGCGHSGKNLHILELSE